MNKEKRKKFLRTFGWLFCVSALTIACQVAIFGFERLSRLGISILIGTCSGLIGGFSALLASPYGSGDKERLSKVGSTITTLLAGYLLAKVIDPLVTNALQKPENIFVLLSDPYNGANVLLAIIGFLGGFLGTYQFRAYISGELLNDEKALATETSRKDGAKDEEITEPSQKLERVPIKEDVQRSDNLSIGHE